jgi:hypothetical protein
MQSQDILFPVCGLILLTLIVQVTLVRGRVGAIKRARVNPQAIADSARFDEVMKGLENISDNFENLFEMPVLFYVATVLVFTLQLTDSFYVFAGWAFVILRCLHSWIHCSYNKIMHRAYAYFLSSIILWIMWARIGYQLFVR